MKKLFALISILFCLFLTGCQNQSTEKIESIKVNEKEITLYIGSSKTIEYQIFPSNISEKIFLEINDPSIAILEDNKVLGKSYGTTYVTLTSSSNSLIKETISISVIRRNFNLTYDLDGGLFTDEVTKTYEENIGLEVLPTPTKVGYLFKGWYLNGELVESISKDLNTDVTLTAKWEEIYIPKTFTINYILDGGSFHEDVDSSFTENVGLETLPIPLKDGFNFMGWYLNDELVESIDKDVNTDVTLYAKWQMILDIDASIEIINLINALPYHTTYNDYDEIEFIKNKYDSLSIETKELITNIDELNRKINELENIENNINEITYVLGDNIYTSKEELFNNFFSDFYKYIITYHGDEYLKDNSVININSIEEFVFLASDFEGAGYSNLYGIGHLAGRYMLVRDLNGILENQPTSGFFGYCYQNGLYEDLLPFFIRFFAYWRIDEKYANQNNYGADIFAEGWAPTVDIAKFFYYDENNLPTKALYTDRMIDCFSNIASIVYTSLPSTPIEGMLLPTNLKLRGYVFEGWYDNPLFDGEPIKEITDTSKKIILYAKWSKDTASVDKDSAELVDVYINNLTTTVANVNKQTVKYVRDMYDALSFDAKRQVKTYNTLIELEEKYADFFLNPITVNVSTKIDDELTLEFIKNDFISDFNTYTNSSITNPEQFVSGKYTYMKKMSNFFMNDANYSKWGYLLDVLYEEGCFAGLEIQINRIKSKGSGDLEYVTAALGLLLQASDESTNSEVLVDYSKKDKIDSVLNSYGTYQMIFEKAIYLPSININGYEFLGFYDSNNNLVTKASENMDTNLVAIYKKK